MKPGSFILNGESSEKYGTFIQDRPLIESPNRRGDQRTVFGRSGDILFDEEAYDNTTMELSLFVEGTDGRTASVNRERIHALFDSGSYMDFIPYFDNRKIYKVKVTDFPKFTSKHYMDEGQSFDVQLTVKPYKYYVSSDMVTLTGTGQIYNSSPKESLPRITIYGTGDVTLSVNGREFVIRNVTEQITLDSQHLNAYQKIPGGQNSNANDKTYTRLYPYLDVESNIISWTGVVSKVEVEPRWRTLA